MANINLKGLNLTNLASGGRGIVNAPKKEKEVAQQQVVQQEVVQETKVEENKTNAKEVTLDIPDYSNIKTFNDPMSQASIIKKINGIKKDVCSMFMEREEVVSSMFLSIVSRQHLIMIGPPGTGK